MLASLKHYWPIHLAVVAGAAVATAVLAGALAVGDSVRASLRAIALDRLGTIESAFVAPRFFREALARELDAAPLIVTAGSAELDGGARASGVSIHGVDGRFFETFGATAPSAFGPSDPSGPRPVFPPVVINAALARELGASEGSALLLQFQRAADVPTDSLMGDADLDAVLGSLRVVVAEVVPDTGLGTFGLIPSQRVPFDAFVPLERLARALGARDRINALVSAQPAAATNERLERAVTPDDLGLTLAARSGFLEVSSRQFVLAPETVESIHAAAQAMGGRAHDIQAYLANRLSLGERSVPYSMVVALDPLEAADDAPLVLTNGEPAPRISEQGILLNSWAAERLGATPGAEIELTYFVVGPREELREETARLQLEGVVALSGLGADRGLVPDYPGIREARDMAAWDPPFPVDLSRIGPEDEAYWDEHGATPKAFVALDTGERLWASHHGHVTAVRIAWPAATASKEQEQALAAELLQRIDPARFGLGFEPVRERALEGARGATDFGPLFLAFSVFLIASAALLVGLLFRLGVERRAKEVGLLLAAGWRVRSVRARLLAEGAVLAIAGGLIGIAVGIGYAALMVAGLRTLWRPAVGSSALVLSATPASLAIGFVAGVLVVLLSTALAVRRLVRIPPARLLAGAANEPARRSRATASRMIAVVAGIGAIALGAYAVAAGRATSPGLAFGSGALVLVAGLAGFAAWCRRPRPRPLGTGFAARAAMAARNSAWSPGRSILSVALVASASFVLGVVAASRTEGTHEAAESREGGGGGFALLGESAVPIYHDLATARGRQALGFTAESEALFEGVEIQRFRVRRGDDASCLNLYRPSEPRLVGVAPDLIDRGGFAFARHAELPQGARGPWDLLRQPLEPGVIPAIADLNSATWVLHLGLGDELSLEDEMGRPVRLRLVALLSRSLFQSELLIAEEAMRAHFPSIAGDSFFLIEAPPERTRALGETLEAVLEPFGFDATPVAERLASYRVVENTYMATFQALGGLGLLLGTIGLGVVLVRNALERRGELAALRAIGFKRATLGWLVLTENAFVLGVGLAIGALAALVAVAPRLLDARPSLASLALTATAVVATGMLASFAALSAVLRAPLLPSLKDEG